VRKVTPAMESHSGYGVYPQTASLGEAVARTPCRGILARRVKAFERHGIRGFPGLFLACFARTLPASRGRVGAGAVRIPGLPTGLPMGCHLASAFEASLASMPRSLLGAAPFLAQDSRVLLRNLKRVRL